MKSNGDGTFTDLVSGTAHYYDKDGYMFDSYSDDDEPDVTQTYGDSSIVMSESDFITLLLHEGERDAPLVMDPFEESRYPLMRFLMIKTDSGVRYQMNPDRSLFRLPDDAPIAVSPDGAHVAVRIDDDTIRFQYIWHGD